MNYFLLCNLSILYDVLVFSLENKRESSEVEQNQMITDVRGSFFPAFIRDLDSSLAGVHTDLTFHMITEHKPSYALLQDFLYLLLPLSL